MALVLLGPAAGGAKATTFSFPGGDPALLQRLQAAFDRGRLPHLDDHVILEAPCPRFPDGSRPCAEPVRPFRIWIPDTAHTNAYSDEQLTAMITHEYAHTLMYREASQADWIEFVAAAGLPLGTRSASSDPLPGQPAPPEELWADAYSACATSPGRSLDGYGYGWSNIGGERTELMCAWFSSWLIRLGAHDPPALPSPLSEAPAATSPVPTPQGPDPTAPPMTHSEACKPPANPRRPRTRKAAARARYAALAYIRTTASPDICERYSEVVVTQIGRARFVARAVVSWPTGTGRARDTTTMRLRLRVLPRVVRGVEPFFDRRFRIKI